MKHIYDVLYIGNYTKDTIITPAGTKYVDGGGSELCRPRGCLAWPESGGCDPARKEDDRVVDKFA